MFISDSNAENRVEYVHLPLLLLDWDTTTTTNNNNNACQELKGCAVKDEVTYEATIQGLGSINF